MYNNINIGVYGPASAPATYKTVILKPNIIDGVNLLTQEMMDSVNTKYVIKHDFVLTKDVVENSVNVLSTNISQCVNPNYANAMSAYNAAHDAWIDADNAYTNNPNETTLAAKNIAYAAYNTAQNVLNNTPLFYYYASKSVSIKKYNHINLGEGAVLLNSTLNGIVEFDTAASDMVVYIGSTIPDTYSYTVKNAIIMHSGCLIEFDGGSIDKGVIYGNDTVLIYRSSIEDVVKGTELLDTWVYNNFQLDKLDNTNGMGRIYLKPNQAFANQLTQKNTIYVIQHDYDLGGKSVTIPEGCLLEFYGGAIYNGTLVGQSTILIYHQELDDIFHNITRQGTFVYNNTLSADEESLTEQGNLVKIKNAGVQGKHLNSNVVDDEDIHLTSDNKLQFKDRGTTDGMGRIILRKNKTFAEQLTQENTIYEIRYDFDLNGESVTIPANCVLEFDGGSLSNGTINGTIAISGDTKGVKCGISGNITNEFKLYDSGDATINSSIISSCKAGIDLMENISIKSCRLYSSINGNGNLVQFTNTDAIDALVIQNSENIILENIRFKKDRSIVDVYKTHVVKISDCNNVIIQNCYLEGGINIRTTREYWNEHNSTCSGLIITNCKFDIDWTPINDINPDQTIQDDIFTIAGMANVEISNNTINFKNVNRVFKISAFVTSQKQEIEFKNMSETILIINNYILGVNELDNGKQVIDLYTKGTHVKMEHNFIDVKGHQCVLQDKSKGTSSEYENLHVITNNIIKFDSAILNIIEENNLSIIFENNFCLYRRNIGTGYTPIDLAYCNNVIIKNNVFETSVSHAVFITIRDFLNSQDANESYIKNLIIEDNIFPAAEFIVQVTGNRNINVDYLHIIRNIRSVNTKIIRTVATSSIQVKFKAIIIEDMLKTSDNGYPISFTENVSINYLKINIPYELGKRVLQKTNTTTISLLECNVSLASGNNKTALPRIGTTYDLQTYFSSADIGTEFYNKSTHKKLYKDTDSNVWRDSSGFVNGAKSGATRPTLTNADVGYVFFDTNLGKPIYAKAISGNTVTWVDATGTPV